MNLKSVMKISLTALVLFALLGCVSKATFQGLADQAKKIDTDLNELHRQHNELQHRQEILLQEKVALENAKATLIKEKAELESSKAALLQDQAVLVKDNDALTREKDSLAVGNRELEEILAAREDSLTQKIAELRLDMANHVVSCSSRLAAQNRQIGDLEKQLAEQAEQLQERAREIAAQTEQFSQCARQSAEQTALLATAEAANARLSAELHQLRAEKETAVEQMNSTHQALIRKMKSEIDNGQITISELQGKLTVNLIDAILFDSGRAEIKAQGLLVLQKVVDILKEVSGKTIRIEGHTDNVPIGGGLAQKYPSNWELAAARAVNVARFLQDHGIDPHSLNAVAHGEYKPVAANDTEPGRARNRRIEIVLANQE